jgi:hypothetical protein
MTTVALDDIDFTIERLSERGPKPDGRPHTGAARKLCG